MSAIRLLRLSRPAPPLQLSGSRLRAVLPIVLSGRDGPRQNCMDNGVYRTRHLRDQTNRRLLETRLVKAAEGTADQLIDTQLRDACSPSVCRPRADIQDFTAFFPVASNVNDNQAGRTVKPRANPIPACCYRNPHLFTEQPLSKRCE